MGGGCAGDLILQGSRFAYPFRASARPIRRRTPPLLNLVLDLSVKDKTTSACRPAAHTRRNNRLHKFRPPRPKAPRLGRSGSSSACARSRIPKQPPLPYLFDGRCCQAPVMVRTIIQKNPIGANGSPPDHCRRRMFPHLHPSTLPPESDHFTERIARMPKVPIQILPRHPDHRQARSSSGSSSHFPDDLRNRRLACLNTHLNMIELSANRQHTSLWLLCRPDRQFKDMAATRQEPVPSRCLQTCCTDHTPCSDHHIPHPIG